jgi:hypothetical protein
MRRDRNLELELWNLFSGALDLIRPSLGHDSTYTVEKSCLNLSQLFPVMAYSALTSCFLPPHLLRGGNIPYQHELSAIK